MKHLQINITANEMGLIYSYARRVVFVKFWDYATNTNNVMPKPYLTIHLIN